MTFFLSILREIRSPTTDEATSNIYGDDFEEEGISNSSKEDSDSDERERYSDEFENESKNDEDVAGNYSDDSFEEVIEDISDDLSGDKTTDLSQKPSNVMSEEDGELCDESIADDISSASSGLFFSLNNVPTNDMKIYTTEKQGIIFVLLH